MAKKTCLSAESRAQMVEARAVKNHEWDSTSRTRVSSRNTPCSKVGSLGHISAQKDFRIIVE